MVALPIAILPNAISAGRLISAPILALLAFLGLHETFSVLLVIALGSDVVDGWLARKLGVESSLGATLDSLADIMLMVTILYAIWPLHPYVYRDHGVVILTVAALLGIGHLASIVRFGRLASFHTWIIRAGIFAFSVFALVLFLHGFQAWLLYLAASICALGALEHFAMLLLLPEWSADIHGGLPEILRRRRALKTEKKCH